MQFSFGLITFNHFVMITLILYFILWCKTLGLKARYDLTSLDREALCSVYSVNLSILKAPFLMACFF